LMFSLGLLPLTPINARAVAIVSFKETIHSLICVLYPKISSV
jgi:hypothetical protein